MHIVTFTKNRQKHKIGELIVGRQTPPMEGSFGTTSTISQQRIQFVISTSSYVKLVEMMVSEE
jgi:hypothetical protein